MKYALITGSSKGIGLFIAFELAERGYNLLLVASNEEQLVEAQNMLEDRFPVKVKVLALDLTHPDAIDELVAWISENDFHLSVLVNNAGYGLYGEFEKLELNAQMNMLQLNISVLTGLTHRLIPLLADQKPSFILNVASTAAYQAMPLMAVYAASKAYVLSFSRALQKELKALDITVTCLCPGPVNTEFWERARTPSLGFIQRFASSPEDVARAGIKGLFSRRPEIIVGTFNKIGVFASRLLPKTLVESVVTRLFQNKKSRL